MCERCACLKLERCQSTIRSYKKRAFDKVEQAITLSKSMQKLP
jgi:hypothetical protein